MNPCSYAHMNFNKGTKNSLFHVFHPVQVSNQSGLRSLI
jgi:hypothetical protein